MGTHRRLKRERAIARDRERIAFLEKKCAMLECNAYGRYAASGAEHTRGSRPHGVGSTHNPRPLPPSVNARQGEPFLHAPDMERAFTGAAIPQDGSRFADVFTNAVLD